MNPNNSNPEASTPEENPTPRFPGFREIGAKEVLQPGDMYLGIGEDPANAFETEYIGCEVSGYVGEYFRPIPSPSAPHTLEQAVRAINEVETAVLPREAGEAHRPSERCPRWDCYKEAYYLGGKLISCTDNECANYDKEFMQAVAAVTELVSIDGPGPMNPIPSPIDWSRPVQTKLGYPVRIIAIDHRLDKPVIGVIEGSGASFFRRVSDWCYNGKYCPDTPGDCLDLENVPVVDALRGGSK